MSGRELRSGQEERLQMSGLSERAQVGISMFMVEMMLAFTRSYLANLANMPREERAAATTIAVAYLHETTGEMLARGGEGVS